MKKICLFVFIICIFQLYAFVPNNLVWAADGVDETNEMSYVGDFEDESDDCDNDESVGYSTGSVLHDYTETGVQGGTYSSYIYQYDNFMESYFDNLTTNHGHNTIGSCGYVAIDMLLCYYDTYLDDKIVPPEYDQPSVGNCYNMICRRNSPGSMFDKPKGYNSSYYTNDEVQENIDYFNYIDKIKEDSLHAKLLTFGASLTGVNYPNLWPGLNHFGIKQIIHKYMNDVLKFTNNDEYEIWDINHSLNPNKSDEVRDFVIEKINEGYPVLLWIGSENESENGSGEGGSHWVVAYDYDETTDKIYCNFGWGRNSTHATPENYVEELNKDPETNKNYYIYKSALVINIKLPHRCSDNYGVITTDDMGNEVIEYYCYCAEEIELYSNTPTFVRDNLYQHQLLLSCGCNTFQTHIWNKTKDENGHSYICKFCNEYMLITHTFTHISIDNFQHSSKCTYDSCGMEFTYNHNWAFVSVDGTTHTATCTDCGYTETQWHTLQYTSTGSTYHSYTCTDCGYTSSGEHKWGYQTINNTSHRKYCTSCGYISGTESHVVDPTYTDPIGKYRQCKYCKGLYTSNIITPIIKNKIEIEEETE